MKALFAGKRILVVDDGEANVRLLEEILRMHGASVLTAANGLEAIHRTLDDPPDLILMDLQLPEVDGLTATMILKADARTASIPVIAVTAAAMKEDEYRARSAGFDDFVTKPFDTEELLRTLSAFLQPAGGPDG